MGTLEDVFWAHYHILACILHSFFRNVQTMNGGFSGNRSFFSESLRFPPPPFRSFYAFPRRRSCQRRLFVLN